MKIYHAIPFLMLAGVSLGGQSDKAPTPLPQATQQAAETGMPTRPAPTDVTAMRTQFSQKMASELQQMRQKLDEMKKNAANAKDPAVKRQLQLDTELWDMTLAHLNDMTTAMLQVQRPQPEMNRAAQMMRARQMIHQQHMSTAPPQPAHQPGPGEVPQATAPQPAIPSTAPQTATPGSPQ